MLPARARKRDSLLSLRGDWRALERPCRPFIGQNCQSQFSPVFPSEDPHHARLPLWIPPIQKEERNEDRPSFCVLGFVRCSLLAVVASQRKHAHFAHVHGGQGGFVKAVRGLASMGMYGKEGVDGCFPYPWLDPVDSEIG